MQSGIKPISIVTSFEDLVRLNNQQHYLVLQEIEEDMRAAQKKSKKGGLV